jgi:pilus assembly protein FimV
MPCTQCGYELENVFVTVLKRAIAVRKLAQGLALLFAILPGISLPLGLGDIEVNTFLNQPLRAEIKLFSVRASEVADVQVKLAPAEAFNRAGIGRPYVLNQLDFTPMVRKDGQVVIAVTSKKPIREPFLNFLVRVEWPKGRLMREYTLLLDPPSFSNQPKWAGSTGVSPDLPNATPHAISGRDESNMQPFASRQKSTEDSAQTYSTQRGDTLSAIVRERMSHDGMSLQQSMIATLHANPQAFVGDNINNLKTGQLLRLPAQSGVELLSRDEARAEVSRQYATWRESRAKTVVGDATQSSNKQASQVSAKSSQQSTQAGKGPEIKSGTTSQGNLEILASDNEDAQSANRLAGESDSLSKLQKKVALIQELAESRQKENEELSSRIKELEAIVAQQDHLINLQSEEMAKLRQDMSGPQQDTNQTTAASTPAPSDRSIPAEDSVQNTEAKTSVNEPPVSTPTLESSTATVENAPAAANSQDAEPEKSSWLEGVARSALPLGLAGLGVVLAVLAWWVFRGSKSSRPETSAVTSGREYQSESVSAASVAGEQSVQPGKQRSTIPLVAEVRASQKDVVSPAPGTKLQTEGAGEPEPSSAASDSVITDADVYIAYGMYQEAEQGLKEAIARHPERQDYQLKLLEVYHGAQDRLAFDALAGKLHDQGGFGAELWERVVARGREISPANSLYADGRLEKGRPTPAQPAQPTEVGLDEQGNLDVLDLTPDLRWDDQPKSTPEGEPEIVDARTGSDVPAMDTGLEFDVGDLDFETEQGFSPNADSSEQKVQELDASSDELLEFNLSDSELQTLSSSELDADLIDTTIKERPSGEPGLDIDKEASAKELDQISAEQEFAEDRPTEILQPFADIEAFAPLTDQDADLLDMKVSDLLQSDLGELSAESSEIESMLGEGLEADLADSHKATKEFDIGDRDTAILGPENEINTKLELAQAFLDFGDSDGARSTLEEVLEEGDTEQCRRAQELLKQIA